MTSRVPGLERSSGTTAEASQNFVSQNFVMMQLTGRLDWGEVLARPAPSAAPPAP